MNLIIFILLFSLLLVTGLDAQSVYNNDSNSYDSISNLMKEFFGKKILIVVLSVTQTLKGTWMLKQIDSISKKHPTDLKIMGVASIEEGIDKYNYLSLTLFYRSILNNNTFITDSIHSRKTFANPHDLFVWLTKTTQNKRFDTEVRGIWHLYLINENGELKAVFISLPKVIIPLKVLNRILR